MNKIDITETEYEVICSLLYYKSNIKYSKSIREIKTPQYTNEKGWLTGRQIYDKKLFKSQRENIPNITKQVFDKGIIDKKSLVFIDKDKEERDYDVFRLERDKPTFITLFIVFVETNFYYFFNSDYFKSKDIALIYQEIQTSFYDDLNIPQKDRIEDFMYIPRLMSYYLINRKRFLEVFKKVNSFFNSANLNPSIKWDIVLISAVFNQYIQNLFSNQIEIADSNQITLKELIKRMFLHYKIAEYEEKTKKQGGG